MAEESMTSPSRQNRVFRFAPSPNGPLHLGHALSAFLNQDMARETDGRFLLRIEDIDADRSKPEFTAAIIDDLHWLGLDWPEPVRHQSGHFEDYAAAGNALRAQNLLYPCFCSRSDIAAHATGVDPDGAPLYPGTCRHLDRGEQIERLERGDPVQFRLDTGKRLYQNRKATGHQ